MFIILFILVRETAVSSFTRVQIIYQPYRQCCVASVGSCGTFENSYETVYSTTQLYIREKINILMMVHTKVYVARILNKDIYYLIFIRSIQCKGLREKESSPLLRRRRRRRRPHMEPERAPSSVGDAIRKKKEYSR